MKNFESSSRCRTWSMALLLSAVALVTVGCGGGGRDPILGTGGATAVGGTVPVAPTVTSNVPATDAINVPVTTNVTATFSKAMDPATITAANLTVTCVAPCVSPTVSPTYDVATRTATFNPDTPTGVLLANTRYTATVRNAVKDTVGLALASNFVWAFTTAVDTAPPTVTAVNPDAAAVPPTTACLTKVVNATFSKPMDLSTINTGSFTVQPNVPPLGAALGGQVNYDVSTRVATFTATNPLAAGNYTATITTAAKDLAGNALAVNKVWTFVATGAACPTPAVAPNILASADRFGNFGGTAGMTNKGTLTRINGAGGTAADIGTIATTTSTVTGFQDSALDVYTVVPGVNQGLVSGKIYTCTTSTTGPTNPTNGVNAASCAKATQARLDALAAYNSLAAQPDSGLPTPANLANVTLAPGVYKAPSGSFLIEGGDLTLDAQGDANAVFVFQMATTLTVGGPGAAAPQSVKLINGALAKNVYWQVGSAAIINAGGGGTMVGTIISQAGAAFSTAGNVIPVALNGRVLSLGASVTMVNTVVTVPAP